MKLFLSILATSGIFGTFFGAWKLGKYTSDKPKLSKFIDWFSLILIFVLMTLTFYASIK